MSYDLARIKEAEKLLSNLLAPEISQIVEAITAQPGSGKSFFLEIPDGSDIDLSIEDLSSLVARTSNIYGRAARFAGMAKADMKLAEGRYKHKFKMGRKGKNEAEREASGMEAAHEEYLKLNVSESVVELAESMENAARVASESARKLLDKSHASRIAQYRESKGMLKESDWVVS